jgi:hypothetical protein
MHIPGEVRQDRVEIPFLKLFLTVAGAIVVSLAAIGVAAWLWRAFAPTPTALHPGEVPLPPPPSKLGIYYDLIDLTQDGVKRHEADRRWLDSYGWVDRQRGVVHVPIETAIDMALRQGQRP